MVDSTMKFVIKYYRYCIHILFAYINCYKVFYFLMFLKRVKIIMAISYYQTI